MRLQPAPASSNPALPQVRRNNRPLLLTVSVLILFGCTLWLMSRPLSAFHPEVSVLRSGTLDKDRHLIWVRLDSMQSLLHQRVETSLLTEKCEENRWEIRLTDPQRQAGFESLLLSNMSLKDWTNIPGMPIHPVDNGIGFTLPVNEREGIRYVHTPADILYSLLTN